jgi:hypothetical protein
MVTPQNASKHNTPRVRTKSEGGLGRHFRQSNNCKDRIGWSLSIFAK